MAKDDASRLPDDTQTRIVALVERSAPNKDRPMLPPEIEDKLDPVERRTAACYADAEELTFRVNQLARRIAAGNK